MILKQNGVGKRPNAMQIITIENETYTLTNFEYRDECYVLLNDLTINAQKKAIQEDQSEF
jgi:hypothetical protein